MSGHAQFFYRSRFGFHAVRNLREDVQRAPVRWLIASASSEPVSAGCNRNQHSEQAAGYLLKEVRQSPVPVRSKVLKALKSDRSSDDDTQRHENSPRVSQAEQYTDDRIRPSRS